MKKVFIFLVVLSGLILSINVQGQSRYYMYAESAGGSEYIDNFRTKTDDNNIWGICFTAGSYPRGFVNKNGRWGFLNNKIESPGNAVVISRTIDGIDNLTIGATGWICAEGFSVRKIWEGITHTLDLLTDDGKSTITSNGDPKGLHIRSAIGKQIYLYDKVSIDDRLTIADVPNSPYRLNVGGSMYTENRGIKTLYGINTSNNSAWIGTQSKHGLYLGTNDSPGLYIDPNHQDVYIGFNHQDVEKIRDGLKQNNCLFVKKGILSEDYTIAPQSSWADYVFKEDYKLTDLDEVETFIDENKHLPDVPSASQVADDGYSQHEMNKVLLQKIEELTLYTIQQNKKIKELEAKVEEMK